MVLAVATLVSYALRLVGGALSDRFDANKPLLTAGYGLSAIAKPLFAYAGAWHDVAALRSAERLGKALRAAPKDKLIGLSANSGAEGGSFGLVKSLDVAGEFCGLLVLLLALAWFGATEASFRTIFLASALPGMLALIVLIVFVRDQRGGQRKSLSLQLKLESKLRRNVLIFCGVSTFMFSEAYFLLLANEHGYPMVSMIALLLAARCIPMLISVPIGQALDRFSAAWLLSFGYLLGVLAMAALLFSGGFALVLAFLLFGISDLFMLTSIRSDISKRADNQGLAFGMFYFLVAISTAAGALLVGFVWSLFGSETAVLLSCAGVLVMTVLHFMFGHQPNPPGQA
ncbi:MAG: MFS transporter [Pseudomonadota bacterium]